MGGGGPDTSASSAMMMGGGGGGAAGGSGGGVAGMHNNECLVYVNTLEACSSFAVRLKEMLERDASAAFGVGRGGGGGVGAGHDAERVMSCLQELGATRALFSRAASDCLEEVSVLLFWSVECVCVCSRVWRVVSRARVCIRFVGDLAPCVGSREIDRCFFFS